MSRQRAPHRGVKPARKALAHSTPARRAPRQDLYFFLLKPVCQICENFKIYSKIIF